MRDDFLNIEQLDHRKVLQMQIYRCIDRETVSNFHMSRAEVLIYDVEVM